ncbi:MAG: hypothetical protein V4710_13640 [Verrucomicrobiota bacterium]
MSTSNLEIASLADNPQFTFNFIVFNQLRHRRGLAAALVVVIVDGVDDDVVWMSEKDLRNSIEIFGLSTPLLTALAHYEEATPQPEAA